MKVFYSTLLLVICALFAQSQSYTQTYTLQDLNGVPDVQTSTSQVSPCPGVMTFTQIPSGVNVDSVRVTYDYFTSLLGFGSPATQRSYVRCTTTGVSEANLALASSFPLGPNTASYNRLLTIANGPTSGNLTFELHAGHNALIPGGCSGSNQFVLNNSWTITVYTSGSAACPNPSSLTQTNSQVNAIQVDWTPGGSETSWELRHGLSGTALSAMTSSVVSTHPSIVSGLDSATSYDFYVRAICGANDSSFWEGPLTAATDTPVCAAPTNGIASGITSTEASIGWTENGFATEWEIEWGPQGFQLGTGTFVTGAQSNPWLLQNLNPVTSYEAYVRSDCGLNESGWLGPISFSTLPGVCLAPTSLTAGNTSATSADVSWTNSATYLACDLEYGPTGFTLGSGTSLNGIQGNTQTITGLTPGTAYEVYVRGACTVVSSSSWTGPEAFNTSISIDDLESEGIKIYPNPASNLLNIELLNQDDLTIVDASGRVVLESRLFEGQNKVDISGLTAGWYIINISAVHKPILINR